MDSGIHNTTGVAEERLPELLAPGNVGLKHGLIYAPRAVALTGAGTGHYWGLTDQNCLVEDPATGNIRVTNSACETQMELQSDGSYRPRFGADVNQTFYHDAEAGRFIL